MLSTAAMTLVACACLRPDGLAQTRAPLSVLTVHWSSEDFPSNPAADRIIRSTLSDSGLPIDYFAEYLESDRFPEGIASDALRHYIREKYQGTRFDVVLAHATPALQFVIRNRGDLFPHAPIVFAAVGLPDDYPADVTAHMTGIVSGPGFQETLEMALRIHPATRRVLVVAESPRSALREIVKNELKELDTRVQLEYITYPVPQMLEVVRNAPDDSLVLFVRHSQDTPGNVLRPTDVARLVASASPVPVYAITEDMIGTGVVGGMVYSVQSIGTRLAQMTVDLLKGENVRDIPIEHASDHPVFDSRELRRWNIERSQLPAGSIILFQSQSFFMLYRNYVIGGLVIFVAQLALIGSLLLQRMRRRRAEEATRTSEERYRSVVDTQS